MKTDINTFTESFDNEKLNGIYRGIIEDNLDPEKLGRCKIRIFGLHSPNKTTTKIDGIPTTDLPWAEPVLGLFEGSMSGFGAWTVPLKGSCVFIFFEAGNFLQPRYFATVPGKPTQQTHGFSDKQGFSDPEKIYPIKTVKKPHQPNALNESDYHKLARNEELDKTINKTKKDQKDIGVSTANGNTWDEPDPYYSAKYPNNKVFATHSGITIELDDTPDNERIHVYHPSNTYIEISAQGDIVIRNAKDKFEIVDENKNIHIKSDENKTVDNNQTNKVGNNVTETIGGKENITVSGNYTLTASMIYLN